MLFPRFLNRISQLTVATAFVAVSGFAIAQNSQAADSTIAMVGNLSSVPAPELPVSSWLTLDSNSGQVIAAQDATKKVEPASLTKLMAAYIIFDALEKQRLSLEQEVNVSVKAWQTEGSRMYLPPNTQVSVDELLQGMIVQSGNDATVALAEALSGSEEAFVSLMNDEAKRQGLNNTFFENSSGLPGENHLTTAYDLSVLANNLVNDFPQYLHYYSQKEYTFNDIKQHNRNRLLWIDSTVDGLKTGHTKSAGYCLVTTAERDGRRVITVITGAESDASRTENSLKLLNWSFQNFETLKLFDENSSVVDAKVWQGKQDTVALGAGKPIWVTVPSGKSLDVKPVVDYTQPLVAPLSKGDQVGSVALSLDDVVLAEQKLYVLSDVAKAGFIGRTFDRIRMMFN